MPSAEFVAGRSFLHDRKCGQVLSLETEAFQEAKRRAEKITDSLYLSQVHYKFR